MWLVSIYLALCGLLLLAWVYKNRNSYWQRRHVPFVRSCLAVGNLKDLLLTSISFGELFQRMYEHSDISQAPLGGIYILNRPAVILRDPDLMNAVLIKHFDKFLNRYEGSNFRHDAMGALCLPLSKYHIWRDSRKVMSAIYTSGRIKHRMYPLMLQIAMDLEKFVELKQAASQVLEVKELCALFTTDLTSILHYGVEAQGLKRGDSALRQQTRQLFDINLKRLLDFFIVFFLPHLTGSLRAKVFSHSYMDFMRQFTNDIFRQRSGGTAAQFEGDLLDVLKKYQKLCTDSSHFSQHPDFISSQVAIFLLAGFETSSSVIGFILYELAKQPQLQKRLRQELQQAFKDQATLCYEKLQELSLLTQVVYEGLRLYPAASFINRECTAVDEKGKAMGFQLTPEVYIPHGMPVYISIMGVQRDAKFWPQPDEFIPERFTPSAMASRHPMTFIPFGAGPHACIGSRLGLLQVKLGLAHILKNYRMETCEQTVKKIKYDPKSFMLQAKGGIYLKFIRDS